MAYDYTDVANHGIKIRWQAIKDEHVCDEICSLRMLVLLDALPSYYDR